LGASTKPGAIHLAATTVSLKEITAARSARRELNRQIGERASIVDRLIAVHAPPPPNPAATATPAPAQPAPQLKRYREE
jgi:putative transposase